MKPVVLRFVCAAGAICLGCGSSSSLAGDTPLSLESVLAKWEEVSKACQTLDVKFTVVRYDEFDHDCPKTLCARFYYEAPSFARYEILDSGKAKAHAPSRTERAFVWTAEGLFLVSRGEKTCEFWPTHTMARVRESIEKMPERTWWERFSKGYSLLAGWPAEFATSDDFLPLLLNKNTQAQRQRFDIRIEQRDGRVILAAVPKQKSPIFREVQVMLEKGSYRLVAHQVVTTSGNKGDTTVHVVEGLKVNSRPPDRDELLTAVPAGYKVIRAEELIFGRGDRQHERAR
jgi:hypothetical protein